jgi:hypothetical protein
MIRLKLNDVQWQKVEAFLRADAKAGMPGYSSRWCCGGSEQAFRGVYLPSGFGP